MKLKGMSEFSLAAILAEEFRGESYALSARDLVECEVGVIEENEGIDDEHMSISPSSLAWALYRIRWNRYVRNETDAAVAAKIADALTARWIRNSRRWTDEMKRRIAEKENEVPF